MKCAKVRTRLEEYASGELPASEREEVAKHLDLCAACRAEAEALVRAGEALRALAQVERAPEMLGDLRARLAPRPRRTWRWAVAGAVALAAAAALLLCAQRPAVRPLTLPAPAKVETRAPQGDAGVQTATALAPIPQSDREVPAMAEHRHRRLVKRPAGAGARNGAASALKYRSNGPAPQAAEPAAPQDVPVEVAQAPGGVILLLGEPEPILPSGSCYLEVTFPDGGKSVVDQAVQRDAAGEPTAVQVSYQQTAAAGPRKEG
jgi:hypothetical protein